METPSFNGPVRIAETSFGGLEEPQDRPAFATALPTTVRDTICAPSLAALESAPNILGHIAFANALVEQVAFLDARWNIIAVNRAWTRAALPGTTCELGVGDNFLQLCKIRRLGGDEAATAMAHAMLGMDEAETVDFEQLDFGDRAVSGRVYHVRVTTSARAGERWAMLVRYDVTELTKLKRQHKRLAKRLLNAQRDERRRVARDLHDSTAQELVALQLSLMSLRSGENDEADAAFAVVNESLERVQREIRSLSYLYHPPALDERGLSVALQTMCDGFGRRTGLAMNVTLDYPPTRVTGSEATLYRLAQEALANVHRHARASEVDVMLMAGSGRLHIMIRDDGIGFDASEAGRTRMGVGIAAMRERIAEVGGRVTIQSGPKGTTVLANVPIGSE